MNEPIVNVKQGKLRGVVLQSVLGPSYTAFRGVPFAAPPIGELRFKDPESPTAWSGIRDASKNRGIAPQMEKRPPFAIVGDEDCLYLNVYTRSLTETKPVMMWIHGGAFLTGTGNDTYTRPDYLITKDVVLVSPNYRLGAFGFLNLDHKVAPGNQGTKDVLQALIWVKENISNFGGDPNNITIFGASAGGAIVHALTISPSARGLFHKAIIQSGTVTAPWNVAQSWPERCFRLASLLGNDSTDPEEVVKFLRTIPAEKIVEAQVKILTPEEKNAFQLAFVVNSDEKAEKPVLPFMDQLLTNDADIPILIGYTSHEALMFLPDTSEKAIEIYNQFLPEHVKNLVYSQKLENIDYEQLTKQVRDSYFDGKSIDKSELPGFVDLLSEIYFIVPTIRMVDDRRKRKSVPTYLYKYSYVGNQKTSTDLVVNERIVTGASHVDDLAYLFYQSRCKIEDPEPPAAGSKDMVTVERLTRMWSNFAKTGNPTPTCDEYIDTIWKSATKEEFNYLDIGNDLRMLTLGGDSHPIKMYYETHNRN